MTAGRPLPVAWYWPAILVVVDVARHVSTGETAAGGELSGHGVSSTERGKTAEV